MPGLHSKMSQGYAIGQQLVGHRHGFYVNISLNIYGWLQYRPFLMREPFV